MERLQLLIMIGVIVMEIRTHVTGVDAVIRRFDRTIDGMEDAEDSVLVAGARSNNRGFPDAWTGRHGREGAPRDLHLRTEGR